MLLHGMRLKMLDEIDDLDQIDGKLADELADVEQNSPLMIDITYMIKRKRY